MASWTTPIIHATGDVLSVADWNGLSNNETFLYQSPYFLGYNSVTTSLTSGTTTPITLGGTTASGYGFSVSSNTAVVPLTGIYSVSGAVTLSSGAGSGATYLEMEILKNGSGVINGSIIPTYTTFPATAGGGVVSISAGGTLGLSAVQFSGSPLGTLAQSNLTYLHAFFVGSQ